MKLVTTREIVIPAGTEVAVGPCVSTYFTEHGEVLIDFDKDRTGTLRFDMEEAKEIGLVEEVE